MSKKRFTDDRKQLLIRYKIDEKGCVSFNCRIANKVDSLLPNITFEKPTLR